MFVRTRIFENSIGVDTIRWQEERSQAHRYSENDLDAAINRGASSRPPCDFRARVQFKLKYCSSFLERTSKPYYEIEHNENLSVMLKD